MSLTIKQAFEALSDACANGMKNPFFVMRRLKESFADVASKVVDASGDKVTVTQTLTEGTQIGSIKVNNDTTTLYAPAGGGGDYSTTEQNTGIKWIDGTSIYQKTISFGALPNNTSKSVEHGINNLNLIVNFSGLAKRPNPFNIIPLPSSHYQSISSQQEISFNETSITIRTAGDSSSYTDVYITLYYTKTES